jgi:hypothetical protein
VMTLTDKVAHAHREHGVEVSPSERAAIEEIANALDDTEQAEPNQAEPGQA